jgi:hypothetical protein
MSLTRSSRINLDRALSLAAGIAAISAVAVSIYQSGLARAQLRASAWPYLQQANRWVPGQPYARVVSNDGIGPARIRAFSVLIDGKPVPTWAVAMRGLASEIDPKLVYSSFNRGSVLPAGQSHTLLTIADGKLAQSFWAAAQSRLVTITCYCSVYDDCWIADSRLDEPSAVKACPFDSATEFQQ